MWARNYEEEDGGFDISYSYQITRNEPRARWKYSVQAYTPEGRCLGNSYMRGVYDTHMSVDLFKTNTRLFIVTRIRGFIRRYEKNQQPARIVASGEIY